MTLELRPVALPQVPWDELDARPDRVITATRAWLDFLVESQGIEPVAAEVLQGSARVGWFTGGVVRRGGLRFLGSPLRGWTTAMIGFTLDDGISRPDAAVALARFAFADLDCVHLEVADRSFDPAMTPPAGFASSTLPGYELDLRADDDELLRGMKRDARYNIGLARRKGVTIEVVDPVDPGDFAPVYYAQVSEAFAKRHLPVTYPLARVEAMIRHVGPTGKLLLLRARTDDGAIAATGIFPGQPGGTAEYWMGGSTRSLQALKPNELLMWTALRTWRDRGATTMDFGGGGSYKAKYGGRPNALLSLRSSRYPVLERARSVGLELRRRHRLLLRRRGAAR